MTANKLTIAVDIEPILKARKSGVGYYTEGLFTALAHTDPDAISLIGYHYSDVPEGFALPDLHNVIYERTLLPRKILFGVRRLGLTLPLEVFTRTRADAYVFPDYFMFPSMHKKPVYTTVHDTYFMVSPTEVSKRNASALRRFVPYASDHSRRLLTVSEFSKSEITKYFGTSPNKITVTPIPPIAPTLLSRQNALRALARFGITDNFLLFIGNIEPRKNLANLLRAYRTLPASFVARYPLVLAGGKGWNDDEITKEIEFTKSAKVPLVQTGYVSEEERAALYSNAAAVILPSKYEGFGMQLLEAMSYQKPIFASDISVFREVAANAAVYFRQNDPSSIASSLLLLDDRRAMSKLIIAQNQVIQRFNWKQVAGKLIDIIRQDIASLE